MSQEYKMVPVTPTAEMLLAVGGRVTVDVWNAMLTAAPVPPADDTVVYRYQHEGAPGQWFYTRDPRYYSAEPVTLSQLLAALPKDGSLEAPAENVRAMVDEPVAWELTLDGLLKDLTGGYYGPPSSWSNLEKRGYLISPLYRHSQRKLEMADVVKAHMDIPHCPVLTSNQCHALAMKLNACLDEFKRLNGDQS